MVASVNVSTFSCLVPSLGGRHLASAGNAAPASCQLRYGASTQPRGNRKTARCYAIPVASKHGFHEHRKQIGTVCSTDVTSVLKTWKWCSDLTCRVRVLEEHRRGRYSNKTPHITKRAKVSYAQRRKANPIYC